MSSVLPVVLILPCVICCATRPVRTPMPVAVDDTPYAEIGNMSANSARDDLKPVVLTLAMLLAVTFRSADAALRSEEHTSELQSLMRISYAVFCLKKKKTKY